MINFDGDGDGDSTCKQAFGSENNLIYLINFPENITSYDRFSAVQSSTRTLIHNAILFIDTPKMIDTSKLIS